MDDETQVAVTLVIVIGTVVTVTFALPDLVESSVEVAVHVAVPVAFGVSTPEEVIVPFVADQVTAELNAPVPATVAEQTEVCAAVIVVGDAVTVTEVMVGVWTLLAEDELVPPPQPAIRLDTRSREADITTSRVSIVR